MDGLREIEVCSGVRPLYHARVHKTFVHSAFAGGFIILVIIIAYTRQSSPTLRLSEKANCTSESLVIICEIGNMSGPFQILREYDSI